MTIKLLANQVPRFWDAIKFAVNAANSIDSNILAEYMNDILHSLLSNKAQCFVVLDDSRNLVAVLVTKIQIDKATSRKYMYIHTLYIWQKVDVKVWQDVMLYIRQYAEKAECRYISFVSGNPALWARADAIGFTESTRTFTMVI